MKSHEEINTEIRALEAIKPTVRERNVFGDSHHDAIDAQIAVLKKRMNEDHIYGTYGEEACEDAGDTFAENVLEEALRAHEWRGNRLDEDIPLSVDWQELVIK